ncbi:Probable ATP-dependent RNA helicase [hydrothermal vent metagenome]|uniref:Probable ATP-dependent RNA helicase n=1 Tax=hydrothermal vent metagenome TaxID=652676 RepID=A0A1W1CZ78_9ZZZZ
MAKKKKKYLIKLNNKIRNYFDGKPFDEGITDVEEDKLIELIMLLEIVMPSHSKDEMIRMLRRVWSEGGMGIRETIVSYLTESYKSVHKIQNHASTRSIDKVDRILILLDEMEHTQEEENFILEAFIDVSTAKVTQEKIRNKLIYLRLKQRLSALENALDVQFNTGNEMEFYHSFSFALHRYDFNKFLLCKSPAISMDTLSGYDDNQIIDILKVSKAKTIEEKSLEIKHFISHIIDKTHPYLSEEEIHASLKAMPTESKLYHAPISLSILEKIFSAINDKYVLFESNDHFIVEKERHYTLFGTELYYMTSVSYGKPFIYHSIWNHASLPLQEDMNNVNDDLIKHLEIAVHTLKREMQEESQGLDIEDDIYNEFILRFLSPQIKTSFTLKMKEKTKKRVLFHFQEHIKPLKEKQKREALLAKSIRDFKQLFPLARSLKRKIIFHVGPTNSGKTYEALQALKKADTGYYLAPLRLLALEGYENLQKDHISVSLITGEEEIIDEDSTHISSTIEMMNASVDVDVCVIDEIQMIGDRDRGWAWANALIGIPAKTLILTGSLNALSAVQALCTYLDEPLEVKYFKRKSTLSMMDKAVSLKDIEPQTAIVAFSRRDVLSLKQQLSSKYSVSVVYGNLSPEVRKEEARRFREGESQVLVSTDAIAMGLNLPIKTLLFSKDNKFDGLRRRELLPTEVSQIAGRAGRYGMEESGFVGALENNTLETIHTLFHASLPPLQLPVSIMASLEHVMLIGEILETEDISSILNFFADNMEFEGPFSAANIDSMLEIASLVDNYHLDLKTRYYLSCAPASISSPYIESVFHRYIKQIEAGSKVLYIPPRDLPDFAQTSDMLLNAEDRVREISLYLWLSFKFPELFKDTQNALKARLKLNQYIENSLRNISFTKQCRKCKKVLDFSYRFSICDSCHGKNKRGYRSTNRSNNSNRSVFRGRRK